LQTQTSKDDPPSERIAVPTGRQSIQAITLDMALKNGLR